MKLIPLGDEHSAAYNAYLLSQKQSLLYCTADYRAFLEALLGCQSQYWLTVEDGAITGVLPLMTSEGQHGQIINSLPYYGSNGGILASTEQAHDALCAKYNSIIQEQGIAAATLVTNPFTSPYGASIAYDLTDERIGQFTPLSNIENAADELLLRLESSTRRNIRKADKAGVKVKVDNNAIDFLHAVHIENMADIGGKVKSERFFKLFQNYFNADEQYRIYTAEINGEPVAALLVFYFNKTVEYFTPVTRKEFRNMQPMAGILFEALVDAAQRGYCKWNWGGTWVSQEGVYRFKRKWGAEDFKYQYYIKINNRKLLSCSPEELLESYPGFYVAPFDQLIATPFGDNSHE